MTDITDKLPLLAEPFPADEVKWKPQAVKGNRAMAVAYIDARCVQDRLDDVVGPSNWQDSYTVLPDGVTILCKLSIRVGVEWMTKEDVGAPSEQPDGGDRIKAAFSDALKRAAVKWGIGRYLYSLPQQWCDYDQQKRTFVAPPKLPPWALPKSATKAEPTKQQVTEQLKQAVGTGAALQSRKIDGEQLKRLQEIMIRANKEPKALCAHYKVGTLEELTTEQWSDAMGLLKRVIDTMKANQPA